MAQEQDTEKSHEPTPRKLEQARKKGQIAKSADVSVAASYAGLLLFLSFSSGFVVLGLGTPLAVLLDQAPDLSQDIFSGHPSTLFGGLLMSVLATSAIWFVAPAAAVLLSLLAQRAIVFAPSRIEAKASRLSPVENAKNKFGRSGLFEFAKSFAKLLIYSVCLALFLNAKLEEMLGSLAAGPLQVAGVMGRLTLQFLGIVVLIASVIAAFDYLWQWFEFRRQQMMTHKELMDETKESEGDPQMKQQRRQKAQQIAMSQMMGAVPEADVVIVNPTHYAVALKWSREQGSAPMCVAKGVDHVALQIREKAIEAGVAIHRDPPTARALYATVDLGDEIAPEHYKAVAAAIRFADALREKVRNR